MSDTLSPAQKAWVTRRAKMAAAATVPAILPVTSTLAPAPSASAIVNTYSDADLANIKVYRAPEMVAVDEFRMVEIYLDRADVGCGRRRFVVMAMSKDRVRLFNPSRLITIEIPRKQFDMGHLLAKKVDRKLLARLMRENIATADRVNDRVQEDRLSDGGPDAVKVLEWLDGRAA